MRKTGSAINKMKQNVFLRLSANDIKNSLFVMRQLQRAKDIIYSSTLSNPDFERKSIVTYSKYENEEFLTLRVENEKEFKTYAFEPKGNQLKELAKINNHFLETGEFLHVD